MKDKKTIALTLVGVLTLLIAIVGATYAYFTAVGESNTQADVSVGTSKEDILTFEVGSDINLEVTETTFKAGAGNASNSTVAKAILVTGNETNALKAKYNLYLDISKNELTYTSSDNTAELLLKVTDSTGIELTSITGLEYKTVTDGLGSTVKGFDITTKTGLITILSNQEIVAQPSKTDTWNVEVIFVNYNFDQTANAGKSVSAKLQMNKGDYEPTLADYIKSQYTTQGVNNLYLHDITLENGANDGSYRYAGTSDTTNNYVCFGSDEDTCPTDNLYRIIGVFGDKVKLIKSTLSSSTQLGTGGAYYSSTTYYWDRSSSESYNNTWSHSLLNTVNLNTNYINYLNGLGESWANMIAETTWKVGGNTWENIGTSAMYTAYQNEIVNPVTTNTTDGKTEYEAQIGLMYVSDYGYAASPTYWTLQMGYNSSGVSYDYRAATSENWMYSGFYEWTITRCSDDSSYVFFVYSAGNVHNYHLVSDSFGVRPVFYLNSNVTYDRGSGTIDDPYHIA